MPECLCGCGGESIGDFIQGHDQTYRTQTAKMIGSDIPLRELTESAQKYSNGLMSLSEFSDIVRGLFSKIK